MNLVKGVVFNKKLLKSSEETRKNAMAERIKKKGIDGLVDTPMVILSFDEEKLLNKVMAAWCAMDVMAYVPFPKRRFKCQNRTWPQTGLVILTVKEKQNGWQPYQLKDQP